MKTDEVEARRETLERLLVQLRSAKDYYDEAKACLLMRSENERPDDSLPPEKEEAARRLLYGPFALVPDNEWDFLIQGLEQALKGDPDPFRLKAGHRLSKVPRICRVNAVIEVLELKKECKSMFDALGDAAEKFRVSERTIRDWYDDPDIRSSAERRLFLEQYLSQHPLPWSPEDLAEFLYGLKRIETEAQSLRERKQGRRKRKKP